LEIVSGKPMTRRALGLGVSSLLGAATVTKPQKGAPKASALSKRANELLAAKVKDQKFMGVALMAVDGRVVFEKAYGSGDLEWDAPHTTESVFRLGSLSKPFTAVAIAQLAQKGALKTEDPIVKYVQDLPKSWKGVTLHQLLTHSSGVPNYTSQPGFWRQVVMHPNTPQELVSLVRNQPLDFEPGRHWGFSNTNYILLGMVIEQVTKQRYPDYLRQAVLDPLEMKNTGYDVASVVLKHRAHGYTLSPHGLVNATYVDMSVPYSAGGLYSTARDLLRFDQALYSDQLLNANWRERVFTAHILTTVDSSSHGYGWFIAREKGWVQHTHEGGFPGFSTMLARYPEARSTIVLLSNLSTPDIAKMTSALAEMLLPPKAA
jgi:CubicO group peptidase (beta-lactamase class C family)